MVKNDWDGVRLYSTGYSLIALMWGGLAIAEWGFQGPMGLFNAAIFSALGVAYSIQAWRWKPMNERRQRAAVWGFASRVPLAEAHPLPNVGALPLPFTILLRPGWPKFLLALGALVGTYVISDATAYQNHGLHIVNLGNPFELAFFLLPTILIGVLSVFELLPQRIEVTPDGMRVRHPITWIGRKTDTIRWSDARLFAIRGGKPGTPGTYYELSGPTSVVQWRRLRRPHWWSLYRPAIPFAEYDAQMEALIALVSGVTGQPLYDVRKSVPQPQAQPLIPWKENSSD